jgi:diaminohydroxyphosphoribosylaminopyrimidine deaminase/5-amino-6-(5-phosphoribosylamino)uracil reductase
MTGSTPETKRLFRVLIPGVLVCSMADSMTNHEDVLHHVITGGTPPSDRGAVAGATREACCDGAWEAFPAAFRTMTAPMPPPWHDLFGPLRSGAVDDMVVVGQIGQSLDGRIATPTGHSHYINGLPGRVHLHRLRALVDAVVVGVGTVRVDDPQLTVRHVAGPHPARVVLDPNGRIPATARMLAADGARRIVVTTAAAAVRMPPGIEVVALPAPQGHFAPERVLCALAARGLRRILIEGGAHTVSCFLSAGCLDRLHVLVAPIILGGGRPGLALAPIERVDEALRPRVTAYPLGHDMLFDCDLSAHRVVVGRAKTSM